MAHNQGVEVEDVVNSGPGLVFITYPEVVLKMAGGSVWAVVFFSMLVIIGIDSEFCIVESLVTGIVDMYPETLRFANLFKVLNLCTFKITFIFAHQSVPCYKLNFHHFSLKLKLYCTF